MTSVSTDNSFEEAKQWLVKAVAFDNENKLMAAFCCYKEGLSQLMMHLKSVPEAEAEKKSRIRSRLGDYMGRAELLKKRLVESGAAKPSDAQQHTQYKINDGEVGYGYDRIFGHCLSDAVWIRVEDPYIRKVYQIHLFLQFCELCAVHCGCLQQLELVTGVDESEPQKQRDSLQLVAQSLAERQIRLKIVYSDTLHDREIFFSNGWRVKVGRGLCLYRRPDSHLALGAHQLALRKCLETTVDVFHESVLTK